MGPGWYGDPFCEAADQVRWWDGQRWTQHARQLPTRSSAPVARRHERTAAGRYLVSLGLVLVGIGAALVPLLPVVSVPLFGGLVVGYGSWFGACLLCLGLASVVTGSLTALDRLRGKVVPIAASILAVMLVAVGIYGLVTVEQAKQLALTQGNGVFGGLISASVRYGSGLIVLLIVGVVALLVASCSWVLARSEDTHAVPRRAARVGRALGLPQGLRRRINRSAKVVVSPPAVKVPKPSRWRLAKWALLIPASIALVAVGAVGARMADNQPVTSPKAASTPVAEPVGCQYDPYICDTAERLYVASNLKNARLWDSDEVRASARGGRAVPQHEDDGGLFLGRPVRSYTGVGSSVG